MSTSPLPRVLAISGSLRSGSFNTAILQTLATALAGQAEVTVRTLQDVPLYNQDEDTATPPAGVASLRAQVAAADLVVIASPEFNYSLPGVLKNALDWASRPYGQSCFTGKRCVFLTSSPAFTGGARAQMHLREALLSMNAVVVPGPELVLASIHEKLVDGKLPASAVDYPLKAVRAALGL